MFAVRALDKVSDIIAAWPTPIESAKEVGKRAPLN